MAFVVKDRIKETTTTTGTGTYTLAGAASGGYQTFAEVGDGNKTYYACTDGTDWEVGLGTYTASGTTLSRDEILESSNSNSAVNWGSGDKDVFVTLPSSKALILDDLDDYKIDAGNDIIIGYDQPSSFNYLAIQHFGTKSTLRQTEPSSIDGEFEIKGGRFDITSYDDESYIYLDRIGGSNRVRLYGGTTNVLSTYNGGVTITGALSISGNLTVNGTTTTVNSTTVTVDDPVFTLGGDSAPSTDDNKDRGIEFRWHDGSAAKLGFFGYDDSEGKLTFIPDATNTSEVFSGSVGTILANVEGSLTGNADTASAADFLTGLADPNADRLLMWDDSASGHAYVTIGSNLSLSGTTLTSTDTTYSAGTGLSLSGTTFTNTAPDQTVSLTGSGATSVSGTYPSFTISSTNTTYTAGTGLSLSGTTFTNTAPDQTVSLTGSGATSVSGTYPSFTISSTDTNTTYTASTGLNLSGTAFSIDTSVVPQLGQENEFNGNIILSYQDKIEWVAAGNARLTIQDGAGVSYFRNYSGRLDLEGDDVRINYMDGGTTHTGLQVRNVGSTNAAGSLCYNSSIKVEATTGGANLIGSLAVSGTVDGRDIATDGAKLDGIESGATGDQTASEILTAIKTVDGSGSGLDADTLDGVEGSSFLRSDATDTASGTISFTGEPRFGASYSDPDSGVQRDAKFGDNGIAVSGGIKTDTINISGVLTSSSGQSGGIRVGANSSGYPLLTTVNGAEFVIRDTDQIRFSDSTSWDYDKWAGIRYESGSNLMTIGGPTSSKFTSNVSPSDITINFDGLSGTNGLTYEGSTIWHAGNDGSGSGLDADLLDGNHASAFALKSGTTFTGKVIVDQELQITNGNGTQSHFNYQDGSTNYIRGSTTYIDTTVDMNGYHITDIDRIETQSENKDVKFGVWGGTTYGIGMTSGVTYGALNDYAMTFCMNNDTDRGFWWGYSGQTKSAGAMSLTVDGRLTVGSYVLAPNMYIDSVIYHNGNTSTYMQFHATDQWRVVTNNTERLEVTNTLITATVPIYASYFQATSDINLKENIVQVDGAVSKVNKLNGYTYNFIDTPDVPNAGLIAQEVQEVLPEAVKVDENENLTLDYNATIALLVEAIKEQQQQIEELKGKINK